MDLACVGADMVSSNVKEVRVCRWMDKRYVCFLSKLLDSGSSMPRRMPWAAKVVKFLLSSLAEVEG